MLYYFKKCKNTIEMQKKKDLCSVWRRCCDQSNVLKVMVKFRVRDFFFLLGDAPHSGRLV